MRLFDIILKDITQILREKQSLLFLVAMPILFTFFMGFAYQSGENGAESADQRLALGWVNNDPDGLLAQQLFDRLAQSDAVRLVELAPGTVDEALQQGDIAGALVVPVDFSRLAAAGSLSQLELVADPASTQSQTLFQALRGPVTQLMSAAEIARQSAEMLGKPGDAGEFSQAFLAASQAWAETNSVALVRTEMAVAEAKQSWYGDNPYNQASPGILLQFAIMGLVTCGQILVQERKTRTLQRMMTTSLRPWQIIAGHALAMFILVFGQIMLLVIFGQLALGVDYARAPLGTLLVSIGLGLWVSAMGLLIGGLAKDDSQVVLFSLLAMFFFSALGGTWFPLEAAGGAFAAIGRLLPSAWAMAGYQNLLIRGLDLSSVYLPALVLLAYALGFFVLAVWRLRQRSFMTS